MQHVSVCTGHPQACQLSAGKRHSTTSLNCIVDHNLQQNSKKKFRTTPRQVSYGNRRHIIIIIIIIIQRPKLIKVFIYIGYILKYYLGLILFYIFVCGTLQYFVIESNKVISRHTTVQFIFVCF